MPDSPHILILGGTPEENIDGVRYYANDSHPANLGAEAAALLKSQGAKVTLLEPGQSILSAHGLLQAAGHYAGGNINAVLQLASICSFRPAQPSAHKLKVKKETGHTVPMEVVGNVDVGKHLEAMFPGIPVIGYPFSLSRLQERVSGLSPLDEGMTGEGKITMPSPDFCFANASQKSTSSVYGRGEELKGRHIIVTSGPTVERLTLQGDVISNRSSGKQGYAIAEALADMGARVTLVTGPTPLPVPTHPHITIQRVTSAHDMHTAVMAALPADAYIGAAAVADFGMATPIDLKLKENEPYTLRLAQNPDILQSVAVLKTLRPKVVIGFAAETDQAKLVEYAKAKLLAKGADAICANLADAAGNDRNRVTWVSRESAELWEAMDKRAVGQAIGRKLAQMLDLYRDAV